MAHESSEADNCSKIALSTLSIRVNKSLSNNLNLVGSLVEREARLLVLMEHKWQTISHDISSQDLEEMVLEAMKDV